MSTPGNRSVAIQPALAAFAGSVLGVCYLYSNLYLLAWVALVPWLITLAGGRLRRAYGTGLVFGAFLFAIGSYWTAPFIDAISDLERWHGAVLSVAYWFVAAQMFGLLGLALAFCRKHMNWPFVLTLPVFGTNIFEFIPYIFPLNLGITQTGFLMSLQGTDITGPAGLVYLIMMVNGLIADIATGHTPPRSRSSAVAGVLLICWFGYGAFAFRTWELKPNEGESLTFGLVQSDAPASLSIPPPEPGYSYAYPPELRLYEILAEQGADLVIWPETRFKGYQSLAHVRAAFDAYVDRYGAGLLLQDLTENPAGKTFNAALFIEPNGPTQHYHKSRLMAFGETIPKVISLPGVAGTVRQIFGDFYTPLEPGNRPPFFQYGETAWIPLICYEVAFATFVAEAIDAAPHRPQWISVQSNDVWFAGTQQPRLHVEVSRLRAIENRLPVVHVINNGPSVVVSPSGRLMFEAAANERRGYLVKIDMPKQRRPTFYSQHPWLSPFLLMAVAIVLAALSIAKARKNSKTRRGNKRTA